MCAIENAMQLLLTYASDFRTVESPEYHVRAVARIVLLTIQILDTAVAICGGPFVFIDQHHHQYRKK